jgi:hypothetical protein
MTPKVLRDRAHGGTDDGKTAGLGLEEHRRKSIFRLGRYDDGVARPQEHLLAFSAHPALEAGIDPEAPGQCLEAATLRAVAGHTDSDRFRQLGERTEQSVEPFDRYQTP